MRISSQHLVAHRPYHRLSVILENGAHCWIPIHGIVIQQQHSSTTSDPNNVATPTLMLSSTTVTSTDEALRSILFSNGGHRIAISSSPPTNSSFSSSSASSSPLQPLQAVIPEKRGQMCVTLTPVVTVIDGANLQHNTLHYRSTPNGGHENHNHDSSDARLLLHDNEWYQLDIDYYNNNIEPLTCEQVRVFMDLPYHQRASSKDDAHEICITRYHPLSSTFTTSSRPYLVSRRQYPWFRSYGLAQSSCTPLQLPLPPLVTYNHDDIRLYMTQGEAIYHARGPWADVTPPIPGGQRSLRSVRPSSRFTKRVEKFRRSWRHAEEDDEKSSDNSDNEYNSPFPEGYVGHDRWQNNDDDDEDFSAGGQGGAVAAAPAAGGTGGGFGEFAAAVQASFVSYNMEQLRRRVLEDALTLTTGIGDSFAEFTFQSPTSANQREMKRGARTVGNQSDTKRWNGGGDDDQKTLKREETKRVTTTPMTISHQSSSSPPQVISVPDPGRSDWWVCTSVSSSLSSCAFDDVPKLLSTSMSSPLLGVTYPAIEHVGHVTTTTDSLLSSASSSILSASSASISVTTSTSPQANLITLASTRLKAIAKLEKQQRYRAQVLQSSHIWCGPYQKWKGLTKVPQSLTSSSIFSSTSSSSSSSLSVALLTASVASMKAISAPNSTFSSFCTTPTPTSSVNYSIFAPTSVSSSLPATTSPPCPMSPLDDIACPTCPTFPLYQGCTCWSIDPKKNSLRCGRVDCHTPICINCRVSCGDCNTYMCQQCLPPSNKPIRTCGDTITKMHLRSCRHCRRRTCKGPGCLCHSMPCAPDNEMALLTDDTQPQSRMTCRSCGDCELCISCASASVHRRLFPLLLHAICVVDDYLDVVT
jgi:hypothetical protein